VSAEEDVRELVAGIPEFASWTPTKKITLFVWVQHSLRKLERFGTAEIGWCFEALNYKKPNISQTLARMDGGELLHDGRGYYMEGSLRDTYEKDYGEHEITLNVRHLVKDLVNLLPELGEKDIFQEALKCLKHDAGRAAIIMVWNIAFYHLCRYILKHKLQEFNGRIPIRYQGKWKAANMPLIKQYDDFGDEMSEREVIEVASSAAIINGAMHKVYLAKLDERNSAAHPSTNHVTQIQAEGFIDNLIRNTVMLLKI
jgi:hypothetical protein